MKYFFLLGYLFFPIIICAQTVSQKLQTAFAKFEKDTQLAHAISSLYVVDAKTGKVVFEKNAMIGLAPASTQKTITSITAFEILKRDFRYETVLQSVGNIVDTTLEGFLKVIGNGDPTLGSNRYSNTKSQIVLNAFVDAVLKKGIKNITQPTSFNYNVSSYQAIPDGWMMQDIGNYYGAAAHILNWKENQFDIAFNTENGVDVIITSPLYKKFINELKIGALGSGDQAYCYLPITDNTWVLTGTIPTGEKNFKIAAADNEPASTMLTDFFIALNKKNIDGIKIDYFLKKLVQPKVLFKKEKASAILHTHYSPTLDSIIYWFNKKSINLYGEALLKTMGNMVKANADSGVAVVKSFWADKGINKNEINIYDGSGLSPLNRVTTHAQVHILKYAASKDWYKYFLQSLPIYNGMTMKSGTITNVKGFCGYHTAKDGNQYIFSFLVNNYNGKSGELTNKMYSILNELK